MSTPDEIWKDSTWAEGDLITGEDFHNEFAAIYKDGIDVVKVVNANAEVKNEHT